MLIKRRIKVVMAQSEQLNQSLQPCSNPLRESNKRELLKPTSRGITQLQCWIPLPMVQTLSQSMLVMTTVGVKRDPLKAQKGREETCKIEVGVNFLSLRVKDQ